MFYSMVKRHYAQSTARILCFSNEIDRCNAFLTVFIFNATDDNISCKIIRFVVEQETRMLQFE